MGRLPCCDKAGVKKGPWTPEEDIILVSYIQEHGPGNWRSVPTSTGLLRCSKSCRLRWTNYLRPGIKRGNFTEHEEKMIFHLQALLGNRWAAIASYLPERTDNDIKNYWNTHLKKKLRQQQTGLEGFYKVSRIPQSITKGQWERRLQTDIHMAKRALCEALSVDTPSPLLTQQDTKLGTVSKDPFHHASANTDNHLAVRSCETSSSTYASSAENIARLLKGWAKRSPVNQSSSSSPLSTLSAQTKSETRTTQENSFDNRSSIVAATGSSSSDAGFDSLFSFNSSTAHMFPTKSDSANGCYRLQDESKPSLETLNPLGVPLSLLEKWLLDDNCGVSAQAIDDHLMRDLSLDDDGDDHVEAASLLLQ
ncbi:hypothetical protein SAY87_004227 [Trapa incisa]|uniref:Uncharacterized protein n=1 Tax=Trapa incisa TaxID=236973 RepID=A0AAN7JP41_9MYRT|nr:hypothetical protein SAY87_004227 [Trapa incisa]